MILVADTRAAAAELAADDTVVRVRPHEVPPPLFDLLERLVPAEFDADAWTGELVADGGSAVERSPVLAVERAPASQFAALQAAMRVGDALPDDVTCVALHGDGFRGQRGRRWAALRGNLHLCRLARLDADAASVQAALTALPAVAAAEAIERASERAVVPGIKWVNDVVVAGHKVGGVLSATLVADGRVTYALFGIGINVATTPSIERDPRVAPAGSLTDLAGSDAPTLRATTLALWSALDDWIAALRAGEATAVVDAYRDRSLAPGRLVALWPVDDETPGEDPERTGVVRAIRDDLGLDMGDGTVVRTGRLTFLD